MEVWLCWTSALLALVFAAGCQSCQGTRETPPAPAAHQAAPPAAKPQAAKTAVAEDDEIDDDALVLLAEGDEEDGTVPFTVKFSVESMLVDEIEGAKYTWDFGDGSPVSTEASPSHTYQKAGSYTATIRIVDAHGQLGWDEVDIEAEEP